MRSVFVLLRETTGSEVAAHLDRTYPSQREPWVMLVDGDAYLYFDFYRDGPREHEPQDWANIVQQLSGEPAVAVVGDVSGQHPGDEQAAEFVADLLTRFSGAAMDDYTHHLWSLAELREGHRVAGHPFFDYKGWYTEQAPIRGDSYSR